MGVSYLALQVATAQAGNLWQVYELAKQNDRGYAAAQAEFRADQEAPSEARAPLLPQLNASAVRTKDKTEYSNSTSPLYPNSTLDTDTNAYSLNLSQTIYRHDRWVALRQADSKVQRAEAKYNSAKQDLVLRVSQAYFDVLTAKDNLTFAKAEREAVQQQLQQTQQRFQVGLSAITDVHEAQARYDLTVAQAIAAENQLSIAREALREITGAPVSPLALLQDEMPLIKPDPENIDTWVKSAMDNNQTLLANEKSLDIAREEVNRIQAGHYPTLDLVASRSKADTSGDFTLNKDDTTVSLQLNVPLFSGGLVSAQTREAEQRHIQNKELYEQQRRVTERATRNAYLSVGANISQVTALKQALKSSQTAMEATKTGFEVGTRTMVDVLNSQREMYRAERDYTKSRYDYLIETLKLKQAAGTLADDDVKKISGWMK